MNKKILVLGLGQNNFLSFLYSEIKKTDSTFFISVPFIDVNNDKIHDSWMYNNDIINHNITVVNYFRSFLKTLFFRHFYETFFFILFVDKKILKSLHFVIKQLNAKAFTIQNNDFDHFDTFHFHFMQYSYLRELFLVPNGKKIVCSFWGSDLLRTHDILNFYFVKKALNSATIITCQSQELKEIVLSKFGRNLAEKIHIVKFPIYYSVYNLMNTNYDNSEKLRIFKLNNGYSTDKINVLVGHSGSISNNHLSILKSLLNLGCKKKIHLIINLNYAITANEKIEYKQKLFNELEKLECSYVILEKFFVNEELAISRLASDIFLHAPVSDALSGTMLELLYASNIVITGSWLPYKTYRRANLDYYEINDFGELSASLDLVVQNFEEVKKKMLLNRYLIQEHFINNNDIKKWSEILS
jgi:hypothetical protein